MVFYVNAGVGVTNFLDDDVEKQGTAVDGIEVISLEEYIQKGAKYRIIICGDDDKYEAVKKKLDDAGIVKYERCIDFAKLLSRERFVSFSYAKSNEDIILNHVLKDVPDIFWIDVGCNDPIRGSITKAFYDKGFHGINVDMDSDIMEINYIERPRDINLNVGVSNEPGELTYYVQGVFGELNTMVAEHRIENAIERTSKLVTLKMICDEHVPSNETIDFLKIDVEGMEKQVLEGADFKNYRPKIVVMESTLPCTEIPSHEEWESIILSQGYHLAYTHDINRYYVADEASYLDERFIPFEEMLSKYCVLHVDLMEI